MDTPDLPEDSGQRSELTRRKFLVAAGAANAALVAASCTTDAGWDRTSTASSSDATSVATAWTGRGGLDKRPNFLIVMVDEMRSPPVYESAELKAFRKENLPAQERLMANDMTFSNHYTMSAACQPSRTSIFTGAYPSLHGLSSTSGGAKALYEWDMHYLDPATVPTMGDYFRAGGYRTYYEG